MTKNCRQIMKELYKASLYDQETPQYHEML